MAELSTEKQKALALAKARARAAAESEGDPRRGLRPFMGRAMADVLGAPADILNFAARKAEDVTGLSGISSDEPFLGSDYIARNMEAPDPIVAGTVNRVGRALGAEGDVMDPRWLSFPVSASGAQPETLAENVGRGVGAAGASLIPGAAIVKGLQSMGPVASGVGGVLSRPFVETPVRAILADLSAGAGAGAGGMVGEGLAEEAGIDPRTGRMAGEILGGGAAAFGPSLAGAGLRQAGRGAGWLASHTPAGGVLMRAGQRGIEGAKKTFAPMTRAGALPRARERLGQLSADLADDAARFDQPTISKPSPAERTGNLRMMALERAARKQSPALDDFLTSQAAKNEEILRTEMRGIAKGGSPGDTQRYLSGVQGRMRAGIEARVAQAVDNARMKAGKVAPGMKETDASSILRRELDGALAQTRAKEAERWAAVDKSVPVPTSKSVAAFERAKASLGRARESDMPDLAVQLLDRGRNSALSASESAKELHALYSKMKEVARIARSTGEWNKARVAEEIADGAMADLQSSAKLSGALEDAIKFTRELHNTFSRGEVGRVLGFAREGGREMAPELTLGQTIGRSGARGAVAADDLMAATKGRPDAQAAMEDYLRRRFTEAAAKAGDMDPVKGRAWMQQNDELLDRFPALKQSMDEAVESGRFTAEMQSTVTEGFKAAEKGAAAQFIGAKHGQEFDALRQVYATDGPAGVRSLVRAARGDKSGAALDGLKAAVVDHLRRRARSGFDAEGGAVISGNRIRAALDDPQVMGVAKEVLSPKEMLKLSRIMREMDMVGRSASGAGLPDVGGVMPGSPNRLIDFLGRILAAKQSTRIDAGGRGAGLVIAGEFTQRWKNILRSVTFDRAERMLYEAITDDDLFRALLAPVSNPQATERAQRAVAAFLAAEGGMAAGEMQRGDETEEEGQ